MPPQDPGQRREAQPPTVRSGGEEGIEHAGELLLARQRGTKPAAGTPPLLAAPGPLTGHIPAPLPGSGPRERIAHLATSLAAAGYTAYAVPLDHDADFHTLVPFIARVVLDEAR